MQKELSPELIKKFAKVLSTHKFLLSLLTIGVLLRLILSVQIYSGDVNNHIAWGKDSLEQGFAGIYQREFFSGYGTLPPTYPPVPIFLFSVFHGLYNWTYKTAWNLNVSFRAFPSNLIFFLEDEDTLPAFLKVPAILADLGIAFLVFLFAKRLVGEKKSRFPLIAAALVLFNPAFFYNSAYWGQIEAVTLFFVLSSFYLLLYSKKYLWAALVFTLALLVKQTSIVFIPLFALVFFLEFGLKTSVRGLSASVLAFWLAFLPFFKSGNLLTFPFLTYWGKIQTGSGSDFVTDHAFNFWALNSGLGKIPDSTPFIWGLSFRWWGFLIFGFFAVIILYPILMKKLNSPVVLSAAALLPFAAFLFLTRMHERYLEQALPFMLLLAVKDRKVLAIFIIISLFHFANLYHNWWAPRSPLVVEILSQGAVVNNLILVAIGSFFFLLIQYFKGAKLQ